MDRLNIDILALIFIRTDVQTILNCSLVCKHFHETIIESTTIQRFLRGHFYYLPKPIIDKLSCDENPGWSMIHPEKTRSNIERLEPKITTLELPNDHGEGRVYGDYIVTLHGPQFSDDEEEEDEDEDEDQDEDPVALVNESTICSIWYRGEIKRKLMVPFKHDSRFLVIDFEKDVLIVIEPVNDLRHILHSYRFLQDPNQLIEIAQSDEEATWNTQGPPTIQILEEDGKLMLSDRYGFILYDWKTGKEQKRFPPKGFQWQGYKRWVVSPDRMLVVLDYPLVTTDPQAEAEFRKNGRISLAVFNLETIVSSSIEDPGAPDLLLEIPFNEKHRSDISEIVQSSMSISDEALKSLKLGNTRTVPFLMQFPKSRTIFLYLRIEIENMGSHLINIAIPSSHLRLLQKQYQLSYMNTNGLMRNGHSKFSWDNDVNPFKNLAKIPFSDWKNFAEIWVEPEMSFQLSDAGQTQHGYWRVCINTERLNKGSLTITIHDFHGVDRLLCQRFGNDVGSLKRFPYHLGTGSRQEGNVTRSPIHGQSAFAMVQHSSGRRSYTKTFDIGYKAIINEIDFDGTKLVLQTVEWEMPPQIWIFDFGEYILCRDID